MSAGAVSGAEGNPGLGAARVEATPTFTATSMFPSCDPPGWYGKLAALGDFAQRRLPPGLVRASDAWLAHVMSDSRAELGARWLALYLQAPVWRFAWAPGISGLGQAVGNPAPWWFGVLMPSCDKVGRYFPLLIAQARAQPPHSDAALAHLDGWFGQLSDAATGTLADGATIDSFEQALRAVPAWPASDDAPPAPGLIGMDGIDGSDQLRLAAALHAAQRVAGSVWWCAADATRAAAVRVLPGLPEPGDFAGFLHA